MRQPIQKIVVISCIHADSFKKNIAFFTSFVSYEVRNTSTIENTQYIFSNLYNSNSYNRQI